MSSVSERKGTGQQPTNSTALARIPEVLHPFVRQWDLTRVQVDLIKRTCCPQGTSDDQMALFFHECARVGTHPMDRLLIMTLFSDSGDDDSGNTKNAAGKKPVFMTTIDLHRARANSYPDYGGTDEPAYGPAMKIHVEEWKGKGADRKVTKKEIVAPEWAKVTAYKMRGGIKTPYVGIARWKEFYPGPSRGKFWHAMPYNQLGKCAEAQALRKGWPKKLGRLYVTEEMDRALAAEDATPVGRGRTAKAAETVETHDPLPDPAGVHDITDAEELDTPPADRWEALNITTGKSKGSNVPIWKLDARNGEGQAKAFYTRDAKLAAALTQLKAKSTLFTLGYHAAGNINNLEEVAPLS